MPDDSFRRWADFLGPGTVTQLIPKFLTETEELAIARVFAVSESATGTVSHSRWMQR